MNDPRARALVAEAISRNYSRRTILRRAAALGLSAPVIAAVLAACGSSSSNTPAATTASSGSSRVQHRRQRHPVRRPSPRADQDLLAHGGIVNANTTLGDKGIGNPILDQSEYWTEWLVFNKLVKYDDKGNQIPDLAKEWKYSDDSLTLTLTLNDAKWHDGEPFTSADVLFTFDKVKDKNTKTSYGSRLQVGDEYVDWKAPDDHTVVITMKQPYAPFLYGLSQIAIVPKHILENSSDINTDPFNQKPVGTGPFKLTEWQSDQYVKYVRNDDYFMGKPAADGWTNYFMSDTDAGAAALDKGEIDMMFTPPEMQPRYEKNSDFVLHNYVYYTPITLAFNMKHPVLQDLTVRKAISMAIDKKTLTDTVTKGRGLLANNQYATTGPLDKYNNYKEVDYQKEYPFDVEAAKKLLDDAGWTRRR